MKRLLLAFLLLCLPLAPVGWTGMTCSQNQTTATYNTLLTIGTAVNSAYAAYNDQVVAGKATFNTNVAKAYNDFQAGYLVAVNASSGVLSAPAPANLTDLANAVYAAIKQYTK